MFGKGANGAMNSVMDNDNDVIVIVTERFERRLSDETGKLRVEMATESGKLRAEMATEFGRVRAEMAAGFGSLRTEIAQLRAEMIERNGDLMKWRMPAAVSRYFTASKASHCSA